MIFHEYREEELPDTIHLENMQKMSHKEHKRSINIFTDEMDEDKRLKNIISMYKFG